MDSYYALGSYQRKITTASDVAQTWFNRGLNWCYGYNHEEAIACFERALAADPDCAMAHWGIAYAVGPNYNKAWEHFDETDKRQSLARAFAASEAARAGAGRTSPVEQALISALAARYPQAEPIEDCRPWNDAFADAMRPIFDAFPEDLEVCTIFVEAIMNRTPWRLWDLTTGQPADGAGTVEVISVLEGAFDRLKAQGAWQHPGLLHLYIHVMEMSPHPERALRAGDQLRDLVPDAGHLIHMPTHIDILCGHYHAVVDGNYKAILADRKFLERDGAMNFYTAYRIHNYHFMIYGAMFLGQYGAALMAADELIETVPVALLRMQSPPMADWLEGYLPMKQHVLVRFGKWREIIAQEIPEDADLYRVTTAMIRYAKGVAHSALGEIDDAEREKALFKAAYARVPESRRVHNNTCVDILMIAEEMLNGELEYRRANYDAAFAHLRQAVVRDDALPYDEPWGWMQPPRHALGALLLEQGEAEAAEAVYRADLGLDGTLSRASQHPDNVWSLHGLYECLRRRGETSESVLIRQRLELAAARADVPITASCYCRLKTAA